MLVSETEITQIKNMVNQKATQNELHECIEIKYFTVNTFFLDFTCKDAIIRVSLNKSRPRPFYYFTNVYYCSNNK